ncbi:MAG: DUF3180 domain-containing protein [Blastococcus sp.]
MRPVRRRDLAVLALGIAVATWLLVRVAYDYLPPLDWWLPAPLAVLALAEALGARTLRARLAAQRAAKDRAAKAARGQAGPKEPPARPAVEVRAVEPLMVARLAVLAQASAYVGAVCAGLWAGVLAHVGPAAGRLTAARSDAVTAVIGVLCATALVVAALWLESVCKVPPASGDEDRLPGGTRA